VVDLFTGRYEASAISEKIKELQHFLRLKPDVPFVPAVTRWRRRTRRPEGRRLRNS
jgi:hypothetical protein